MTRRYSWIKACCVATGAQAVRGTQPRGPLKQISPVEAGRGLEEDAGHSPYRWREPVPRHGGGLQGRKESRRETGTGSDNAENCIWL